MTRRTQTRKSPEHSGGAGQSAERQLAGFVAKYPPDLARQTREARRKMRALLSGAIELVYDNYNALAIGFGPNERASDAVFSIAVFPRWVSLFFFQGVELTDPARILKGSGKRVRHIVLGSAADLERPEVRALMNEALELADLPIASKGRAPLVIKSVSAAQRPRRPSATAASRRRP